MTADARVGVVAFAIAGIAAAGVAAVMLTGGDPAPPIGPLTEPTEYRPGEAAGRVSPGPGGPGAGTNTDPIIDVMTSRSGGVLFVNAAGEFVHVADDRSVIPASADWAELLKSIGTARIQYPAVKSLGEDTWVVPLPQTPGVRLGRTTAERVLGDSLRLPPYSRLRARRTGLDEIIEGKVRTP